MTNFYYYNGKEWSHYRDNIVGHRVATAMKSNLKGRHLERKTAVVVKLDLDAFQFF